jgi:hypothetical protein
MVENHYHICLKIQINLDINNITQGEQMSFNKKAVYGYAAEKDVAMYFDLKRYFVIQFKKDENGLVRCCGPMFVFKNQKLPAPDMQIYKYGKSMFIEVKHTKTCTWDRLNNIWNLSLNLDQYNKYVKLNDLSKIKLGIVWVVDGGIEERSGLASPSGKFCASIDMLKKLNHRIFDSKDPNLTSMIHWNQDDLYEIDKWNFE